MRVGHVPVVATLPVPMAQMGSYATTTFFHPSVPMALFTASSCLVTISTVTPFSRSSRLSPQQRITPIPPSSAAFDLHATNSSSSRRMVRRSECPNNVQVMLLSFNWATEISPVNAPLGLSKTFWAATSMAGARCSRVSRRYKLGGATTTSVLGSGEHRCQTEKGKARERSCRFGTARGRDHAGLKEGKIHLHTKLGSREVVDDFLDGLDRPIPVNKILVRIHCFNSMGKLHSSFSKHTF